MQNHEVSLILWPNIEVGIPTATKAVSQAFRRGRIVKMSETNKQDIYRVLIVDEDAALRETLAGLLRAPNRSVEVRDGARTALEFLRHNPIDVAFVDAALTGASAQHRSEEHTSELQSL